MSYILAISAISVGGTMVAGVQRKSVGHFVLTVFVLGMCSYLEQAMAECVFKSVSEASFPRYPDCFFDDKHKEKVELFCAQGLKGFKNQETQIKKVFKNEEQELDLTFQVPLCKFFRTAETKDRTKLCESKLKDSWIDFGCNCEGIKGKFMKRSAEPHKDGSFKRWMEACQNFRPKSFLSRILKKKNPREPEPPCITEEPISSAAEKVVVQATRAIESETTPIVPPHFVAFENLRDKSDAFVQEHPDYFPSAEPEEKMKNRYDNILSPVNGRFKFKDGKTYINANYVGEKGHETRFIATQAPIEDKDGKVNTQQDFWRMTFESGSPLIVNLLSAEELRKKIKGAPYWPLDQGEEIPVSETHPVGVKLVDVHTEGPFVTRTFKLTHQGAERTVTQVHYTKWPDQGTIPLGELDSLVQKVHKYNPDGKSPTIIHCSAGVGRTGVLATSVLVDEKVRAKEPVSDALIDDLVLDMRKQRRGFVQNDLQLKSIYDFRTEKAKLLETK